MSSKKNERNPLLDYLASKPVKVSQPKKKVVVDTAEQKQRITIHLSKGIIDRAKNAVYWEPGLTLTDLAEQALKVELDKLEKKRGDKYPQRKKDQLKGGRPLQ